MTSTFEGIPDKPIVMLACLILKRAKLKLPCTTRTQAIAIIRGVKPAASKRTPLNIKPCDPNMGSRCVKCGHPIHFGQPCLTVGDSKTDTHITCPKKLKALYEEAIDQVSW
jgi:hypothetical protein